MPGRVRMALVAGVLALCVWGLLTLTARRPPHSPLSSAAANRSPTRTATAEYVGKEACAACHESEFNSYQATAHSQALAEVEPETQPADAQFDHRLSGYSFSVRRAEGAFRHRQWLTGNEDAELIQDFPVKYLIGSGRHTRSYLIEDRGFLVESPITWYESRQAWGLSPGYDRHRHLGFERAADMGCLACHVGRAENIDGALNRIAVHEQAIGCEACHGPGSLHVVQRRAAKNGEAGAAAAALVHPGKLSRELSESICAQCHLRSDATVFVRGRSAADFRPGHALAEYRVDYRLDRPSAQMKVVGHVEQMRLSRCYQESETLTCTNCHDPHAGAATKTASPGLAAAEYRSKCLKCHTETACGLNAAERTKLEAGDNCAACHMPQSPTDIPHIAFTHHRIGIHRPAEPASAAEQGGDDGLAFAELAPLADVSHLSELEQDRCLGLAYLEFAQKQDAPAMEHYRRRAVELLENVRAQGLRDANVDAALARIYWSSSPPRAAQLALAALEDDPLPPSERTNALFVLADVGFRSQQWASAQSALVQLVRLRRHPVDWLLLGLCQAAQGDVSRAIQSLERSAAINPYQADIHEQLARLYERQGQTEPAERRRQLAQLLKDREQARAGGQ